MRENMSLGKYIEKKRIEIGISQRKLGIDINISHSTISRIENDEGLSPDNATLKAIAKRLKLDYNYLLALNHSIEDEPEIRVIQRVYKRMNSFQKKEMLNIFKASFSELYTEEDNLERADG